MTEYSRVFGKRLELPLKESGDHLDTYSDCLKNAGIQITDQHISWGAKKTFEELAEEHLADDSTLRSLASASSAAWIMAYNLLNAVVKLKMKLNV